jgi:hypothetical protein
MTKQQAITLIDRLFACYPDSATTPDTRALFTRYLSDLDANAAETAIEELILDSTALPTIAHIRRSVIEHDSGLPTALEAYREVVQFKAGDEMHPLVLEVCRLLGGSWTIKNSEEPTIMRAQFLKAYGERRDQELRGMNARRFRAA